MNLESLCKFPSCIGTDCEVCALMRNPRALTSRDLSKLARGIKLAAFTGRTAPAPITRTVDVSPVAPVGLAKVLIDEAANKRKAALEAEAARLRAEVAALQTRRSVGLHPMPAPTPVGPVAVDQRAVPTAPPPVPLAPLAPAPSPLPAPVVRFPPTFGPLVKGDWRGLAARVDAGVLSQADGERIGSEWMAGLEVSARA